MYRVNKRDGKIVEFDISKITEAIKKAFEACERQFNENIIDFLALKVTSDFEPKVNDGLVNVEDIQDSVETVLVQAGYADVAKAYILYRRQREKLRNMKSTILDYKDIVDSYVKNIDWRVNLEKYILSEKDTRNPLLADAEVFDYHKKEYLQ